MGSRLKERGSVLRLIVAGLVALAAGACTAGRGTTDAGPDIQVRPERVQVVADALAERLRVMVAAAQTDTAPADAAWLPTGTVLKAQATPGHVALLVPTAR
jgi:hypothetical protein